MTLLLGNCQIERLGYVMAVHGRPCRFMANTERVDSNFDVTLVYEQISKADLVIAQPIFNESNPLHWQHLKLVAKEVVFVPYVFVDGPFSLSAADIGSPVVYGSEVFAQHADKDLGWVLHRFLHGEIDFRNEERLRHSIAELKSRENASGAIPVSDVIESGLRDYPLMVSHNHPSKRLMDEIAKRVFSLLGWAYRPYEMLTHAEQVEYVFSTGEAVFSPYDAQALRLTYPNDDMWWITGHRIIERIWRLRADGPGQ